MTHKKEVVFSLLFVIMVLCTGCSDKDNGENHLFKKKLLRVLTI